MNITMDELFYLVDAMSLMQKRDDRTQTQLMGMERAEREAWKNNLLVASGLITKLREEHVKLRQESILEKM